MKKITTLMVMLMGCVFSALAQTVASTPTTVSDIVSGYYMLMVKSDDDKTDANGNYAYNTPDSYVSYDAKGSTTDFLGKTLTSTDEFAYVFYVEKQSDGKISLRAWKDKEHWWKDCGDPSGWSRNDNPWDLDKFPTSTSIAYFESESVENGFGSYLKIQGKYRENWKNYTGIYYVVCSSGNTMGYKRESPANKAQFRFYAVNNVPDPDDVVSFTYNYTDGEHSKSVAKNLLLIGYDFPEPNDIDFLVGAKPEGKISADDNGKTFDIQCTEHLPFQTSTDAAPIYYYLENVQGTRLYANSGLAFRTAEQAANVNDVRNDLWYVTGNVFDGFKLRNVNSGTEAQSEAMMSHVTKLTLSATSYSSTWDLFKSGEQFGVCAHPGTSYYDGWFRTIDESVKKNYSWSLNANANGVGFQAYEAGNAAFSFRLVPATFTFPMYSGNDDNVYNTFAAPFAVALADDENAVKMYKGAVNTAEKELVLTGVDAVPANAGVMLMGKDSKAQNVTFKVIADAEAPAALDGNELEGTTVELAAADLADKLILGISDETHEVGFFSINDNVATLTANHAYLNKTNSTVQTLSVRLAGQPTGIGQISVDSNKVNTQAPVYDLTGRRVNRTVKGQLYIQNGRKFMAL